MADWKTTIVIGDLHASFEELDITLSKVAETLAKRLEGNQYADDPDLSELIEELREFSLRDEAQEYHDSIDDDIVEDYDEILNSLYDYGDEDYRIWFEREIP